MESNILNLGLLIRKRPEFLTDRNGPDNLALVIASCGGVGYIRIVPATFGSLFGVVLFVWVQYLSNGIAGWIQEKLFHFTPFEFSGTSVIWIFLVILFFAGIWSATRIEKLVGQKDPCIVVIDEVVGQFITFLIAFAYFNWWTVIAGFLAFRFYDIWKPFPTGRLEKLPSGLGIVADDVMAGVYAGMTLLFLCSIGEFIF